MKFFLSNDINRVNWPELAVVFELAPLGYRDPDLLKAVFISSRYRCFLYDGDRIIGAGRALADGVDCSVICDVVVHPDYQGLKQGKRMVNHLVEKSRDHNKVLLYANPGKESFYAKLGFRRMKTAMAIFKDGARAKERGITD